MCLELKNGVICAGTCLQVHSVWGLKMETEKVKKLGGFFKMITNHLSAQSSSQDCCDDKNEEISPCMPP